MHEMGLRFCKGNNGAGVLEIGYGGLDYAVRKKHRNCAMDM
jgi:hypothetical protein